MNPNIKIASVLIFVVLSAGCLSENTDKKSGSDVAPVSTDVITPTPIQTNATSQELLNKLDRMENEIKSMQQQISNLQTRVNRVDLLKSSDKQLIPQVPFKIEIYISEWQTPLTYTFKEGGQAELRSGDFNEIAQYKLYLNNNTIKIESKKYDYYGLVLYDGWATAIYENGWVGWVRRYKVFAPTYNPLTQRYEIS